MENNSKIISCILSRYNEDLSWTLEPPFNNFKYIVYNKGENENFHKENVVSVIKLENVGKDIHTYLHHIVHNYESLTDIVMFLPASMSASYKRDKALALISSTISTNFTNAYFLGQYSPNLKHYFFNYTQANWVPSTKENQYYTTNNYQLLPSTFRPYGKWFAYHFKDNIVNWWSYNNTFSIDKRDIWKYPKSYYEEFLNEVSMANDTEVAHYIERSWNAIFGPFQYTKILEYKM